MQNLAAKIEGTQEIINEMVGKAAFAYGYYQMNADEIGKSQSSSYAEYKTTCQCISMLVEDSLGDVCRFVKSIARELF